MRRRTEEGFPVLQANTKIVPHGTRFPECYQPPKEATK